MQGTANIISSVKKFLTGPYIEELPPGLIRCELGCRVLECSYGKWLGCENRIRRMEEEIAYSKMELGKVTAPTSEQR
jgi:hypothetical protein